MKPEKDRLAFFSSLYENAREKQDELFERMKKAYAQYRGEDTVYGTKQASTVRNITYELIEGQVSTDIPRPCVTGRTKSEKREKNAHRIELLLSGLRDKLPFEKMNDMDERYTYIYGGSVLFAEWDEGLRFYGEDGGVRVVSRSPLDFVGQPGIYEVEDMEYCFLIFDTTREDLIRRYGADPGTEWAEEDNDAVRVIVCYYKNEKGQISRFLWSGDRILSDIDDFYARKFRICSRCGKSEGLCTCEKPAWSLVSQEEEILREDVPLADGRVLPAGSHLPRYRPKHFPLVVRKNTSLEKSLLGQSDCFFIASQQREINQVLSRIHEKLMMAGVYPYKPDDCQFRYDNTVGGKVLNLRPGESSSRFGVLDTTPDITRDLVYIQNTYEDAKRILGLSDSYLGGDEESTVSGKARAIQVAQSEGRLSSKRVMKNAAYAELDRRIFELYLAYADEPRGVSEKDAFGKVQNDAFCRYDFIEQDPVSGRYFYDDAYLFSVDTSLPSRDERTTLWKYNLDNYKEGGFGPVGSDKALARYWAIQERCGYPGAKSCWGFFESSPETGELTLLTKS